MATKNKSPRSSAEVQQEISTIPYKLQLVYSRVGALQERLEFLKAEAYSTIMSDSPDFLTIRDQGAWAARLHLMNPNSGYPAAVLASLRFYEELTEYIEGKKILDPLYLELAEAQAAEHAALHAKLEAQQKLDNAKIAAAARLAAEVDQDPAVVAAAEALASH